jgi:hypothetical protein
MTFPRALPVIMLACQLAGCNAWRRDDRALRAPIPTRRPLQIWSGQRGFDVHGVVIRGDSLRAVPRWKPPECDSCARFYALVAIDSTRVRRFSPLRTGVLVAIISTLVVLTAGIAGAGGPGS